MLSTDEHISKAKDQFQGALEHLKQEFIKLQTGRANPALVEGMLIDVYGSAQPLKNIATITTPDPRTIAIQPWDRANLAAIEKSIRESDIGIQPSNAGTAVMLNIPPLTEERRQDLVKVVHRLTEEAKISVRNARHDCHAKFKELKASDEITEDDVYGGEKSLQEHVDSANLEIDTLAKQKEESVMTV